MLASTPLAASATSWQDLTRRFKDLQANAETVQVSDWSGLQKTINGAKPFTIIQLSKDISCSHNGGDRIKVDGKMITLDLNGHALDRNRDKKHDDGHVIEVTGESVLTITDSSAGGKGVITGGYAERGGGVNIGKKATVILKGGTISGNQAKWGGGVYVHGTLKLQGGTVAKNHADNSGGGIHIGSDGRVEDCTGGTVTENSADDCGGIYNSGSKNVTIVGVTISKNTSKKGGAGFNNNDDGVATLRNCVITGNIADGNGGGIYHKGDGLTIDGCTISDNTANGVDGGGIFARDDMTVKGASKFENNFSFNSGGAIRVTGGTTTIEGGTFTGNEAGDSGGAIYVNDSTLKLYGGTFTGNNAMMQGGGVLVGDDGAIKVHGAPVVQNNTADGNGSNIYLRSGKQIDVDAALRSGARLGVSAEKLDKVFSKNFNKNNANADPATYFTTEDGWVVLKSGNEGVIRTSNWTLLQALTDAAKNGDTIVLDRDYKGIEKDAALNIHKGKTLSIDLNGHKLDRGLKKATPGGAAIMNMGTLTIKDSVGGGVITGGYADDHAGGIWNPGTLTIESGSITGNQCVNNGGGIYNTSTGKLTIKGGTIANNTSGEDGGGIYTEGKVEISGGVIRENTGTSGGAVRIGGGTTTVTGGTMSGNTVKYHGGGIYVANATLNLQGGSIIGNRAQMEGGGVLYGSNATVNVQDAPVVNDNTAPTGANVLVRAGNTIKVTGQLTDGAKLDLLAQDATKVLTSGLQSNNSGDLTPFTYNQEQGVAPTLKDGELFVDLSVKADVWVSDWKGLQTAINNAPSRTRIGLSKSIYADGNTAKQLGGGVDIEKHDDAVIKVHGAPVVKDNTAKTGNNVFLPEEKALKLDGAMTNGAHVSVSAEELYYGGETWNMFVSNDVDEGGHSGVITSGFNTYNKDEDPQKYFASDETSFTVNLRDGEAKIIESDWSNLQRQIDAAQSGATIVLDREWSSVSADNPLTIPAGKTLTLDLNGHTLNRGLIKTIVNGCVISNSGTLTIRDSKGGGRITGGYAFRNGGGIWNIGTLTLEGGSVTGNHAVSYGGGIYNSAAGKLVVTGGSIENNRADQGAGIFNEGAIEYTAGTIRGNTATGDGGGALTILKGTTTITGGKLTGNVSMNNQGGAIYMRGGTVNLYGGEITDNQAAKDGGGILYNNSSVLNVQGGPVVKDNRASRGGNIMLRPNSVIHLTGQLAEDARLDVMAQDTDKVLTNGLAQNGSLDNFTYNDNTGVKPGLKDGELFIDLTVNADVWVKDWKGLQDAVKKATKGQVIALGRNITATSGDGRIKVDGKTITLDLNGYTLDRQRTGKKTSSDGHVIEVVGKSTLTIRDSKGTGVIQGGNATRGGGINVASGSTCILEGGAIRDNKARWGGGVYAHGTFRMSGGMITRNEATIRRKSYVN